MSCFRAQKKGGLAGVMGGGGGGKGKGKKRAFSLSAAMSSAGAPVGMITTSLANGSTKANSTPLPPEETKPSPDSLVSPAPSHIDFWPRCQSRAFSACDADFECFDVLVERANRWMSQYTDFELINCETVDKKVKTVQDIYNANMAYEDDIYPDSIHAMHVKGLRLWYRQRKTVSSHSVAVGYLDAMPKLLNPGEKHPKFETLPTVIESINTRLRQFPLQGNILSVETVQFKIPELDWLDGYRINPKQCSCPDDFFTHTMSFIRVFYKFAQPAFQIIGYHDFTPDVIDEGGIFHPAKYSTFSSLVDKASAWINQSKGIRIANLQTLQVKYRKKKEAGGTRFNPDILFEYKIEDCFRAYFIRVGYVKQTTYTAPSLSYPLPDLTCKTFIPFVKQNSEFQNITEMLERIERFLKVAATSRVDPIYAETVALPEWLTSSEYSECGERTFFDGEWYFQSDKDGNQRGPFRLPLVYAIRVYFDGQFGNLTQRTDSIQVSPESCCRVM